VIHEYKGEVGILQRKCYTRKNSLLRSAHTGTDKVKSAESIIARGVWASRPGPLGGHKKSSWSSTKSVCYGEKHSQC